VCPVGPDGGDQSLVVVDKDGAGQLTSRSVMSVRYVPLTRPEQ
jgi:protein-L-isoaspartate O-methyltransferase